MNKVLRPKFALVFFDIMVYSPSLETHVQHLMKVLAVLQENKLKINKKKCSFGQPSLGYLGNGHIISSQGVFADLKKSNVEMACS